ncbi:FCD domain-containing protein [Ancylobacter oerskovii]|uniref:FCD domain-containing protein n=1 Tax=Ancylobacter oerskovii TaxID=459519 RepID=A0ABW4Z4N3_9HYPH|nr:FCD domain-containing protein [Ancylobacter oerskovii]MBS7543069.1 FCD domain-containing protein [Ancylobacter oerskovii]
MIVPVRERRRHDQRIGQLAWRPDGVPGAASWPCSRPARPTGSHHEHQMILDALLDGDGVRAIALMEDHLGNVEDRLDLDRDTRKSVDLGRLFTGG